MNECLFCRIIQKDIPSTPIYEDELAYAFLDVSPVHPGHTLVVPKIHAATLLDLTPEASASTIRVVQIVARALKKTLHLEGFNIKQNNGVIAGQSIHHVHFHIVPRHTGDGLALWPQGSYPSVEAREEYGQMIRANLSSSYAG